MIPLRVVLVPLVAFGLFQAEAPRPVGVRFDHLHLISPSPDSTVGFYERLFGSTATRRVQILDAVGIGDDEARLLVSSGRLDRRADDTSAFWHFGWGLTTVGESYRAHLLKEVMWEPPFVTLSWNWHLHVLSRHPREAALWYRDVLEGDVVLASERELESWKGDEVGAIVRWRAISIVLHRWDGRPPLDRPGGHRIDHLAFAVDDVPATVRAAVTAGAQVLQREMGAGRQRALINATDGILIEIVDR